MPVDRRQHLRHLLQQHRPVGDLEATHTRDILALLDVPGDPFSRDHFAPGHVTASSFLLSPDGTSVLLIFHGKLHRWLQPGGHVDADDVDVLAAALREVREEVGVTELALAPGWPGLFDVDVHVIPARKADPEHRHFDVRFAFQVQSMAFEAGSDAHAGQWVKLEDVSGLESDASVLRAVSKLMAQRKASDGR